MVTINNNTHLVFCRGKIDKEQTINHIRGLKNVTDVFNKSAFKGGTSTHQFVALKIIGTVLYTLTVGVIKLIIKEFQKFIDWIKYRNDRDAIDHMAWNNVIDGNKRLELHTAVKNLEARKILVNEILEKSNITPPEKEFLQNKSLSYLMNYLALRQDSTTYINLIGKSESELRKKLNQAKQEKLKNWLQEHQIESDIPNRMSEQYKFFKEVLSKLDNLPEKSYQIDLLTKFTSKKICQKKFIHLLQITDSLGKEMDRINDSKLSLEKEFLKDLHFRHGILLQSIKRDFGPHFHKIVGEFRQQWDLINAAAKQHNGSVHTVDGCHFSPAASWPNNTHVFDVLEGRALETVENPITVKKSGVEIPPRITVFTCQSGSGHKMATKGVAQNLTDCSVQVADAYQDILKPADLIHKLAPDCYSEDIYNFLIKHECNSLLEFLGKLVFSFSTVLHPQYNRLISEYIEREKPDMLISTIPFFNPVLLDVAKKYNIPLLIITTDLDISDFQCGLTKARCDIDYPKFKMTTAYEKGPEAGDFLPIIPNFGYPLRKAFEEAISTERLNACREEFEIQSDEGVILTMIGGNSGKPVKEYAKTLHQFTDDEILELNNGKPVRMICLCGSDEVVDEVSRLNRENSSIRFTAVKQTSKIAELFSLPELLCVISKTGGSTINEILKKRVPVICHKKQRVLRWEEGNLKFVKEVGLGVELDFATPDKSKLKEALKQAFVIRKTTQELTFGEGINFGESLRSQVRAMLNMEVENELPKQ